MPELVGTITKITPTRTWDSGFSKREFWVEHGNNPQWPQTTACEVHKDNCAWLDSYQVGQSVVVTYDLEGRPWQKTEADEARVFNTVKCWRLVPSAAEQPPAAPMPPPQQPAAPQQALPGVTPPPAPAQADGIPF